MKKILRAAALSVLLAVFAMPECGAQIRAGDFLPYEVVGEDTVFFDVLDASRIMRKGKGKKNRDWQKYYRLVYNFNKVYPYARDLLHDDRIRKAYLGS